MNNYLRYVQKLKNLIKKQSIKKITKEEEKELLEVKNILKQMKEEKKYLWYISKGK